MKINELSKPLTANALNESLGKNFGQKLQLESFTLSQLEDARNRLRTQLADVETNESFETVHNSDAYQKGKLFLDTINKEIADEKNGVETYMVDANYTDSGKTEFIGKVKYDDDTFTQTLEEAVENEDVYIDTYADEDEPLQLTKIKLVPMTAEEEDKNAGVVRDNDGNVKSEVTNG